MYAGVYGYRVGEESESVSEWSGQDLHSCRSPRPSLRGCNCASRFTSSQSHRGCNAFGRLLFVTHYRRINVLQLRWRPFSRTCNLATCLPSRLQCIWPAAIRYALSPYQCLAAAIAPRRRKKPARRQFSPLGNGQGMADVNTRVQWFLQMWPWRPLQGGFL